MLISVNLLCAAILCLNQQLSGKRPGAVASSKWMCCILCCSTMQMLVWHETLRHAAWG